MQTVCKDSHNRTVQTFTISGYHRGNFVVILRSHNHGIVELDFINLFFSRSGVCYILGLFYELLLGQKEKPQTFFKICGLAGETEKGAVMLDNTLFLPDYSVVLTCPVFRCPKKH